MQQQQSMSITHNSAQFHSCKWSGCTNREGKSCPAHNVKCKSCGMVSHFACICRKKQRVTVVQEGTLVNDNADRVMGGAVFLDAVDSLDNGSQPWLVEIKISGIAILLMKVDSRADVLCISTEDHRTLFAQCCACTLHQPD